MKSIIFAMLLLSQMPVFAYRLVGPDPVQMAEEFCARHLESKFPGAALDGDNTTVKPVMGGRNKNGGWLEVSTPFKTSSRSGHQIMTVYVFADPEQSILVYGWQIVWSDGTVTAKGPGDRSK
jgi:hypothetical protein